MIDFIAVGNNIASRRKRQNLTQEELANKLFVTRHRRFVEHVRDLSHHH